MPQLWAGSDQSLEDWEKDLEAIGNMTDEETATMMKAFSDEYEDEEEEFHSPLLSRASVDGKEIGVITVQGPLVQGNSFWALMFGATPYGLLQQAVMEASVDDSLNAAMLHVSSPGGDVNGLNDVVQTLDQFKAVKPLHTFVAGNMHSAAVWLGVQGSQVSASDMSNVGSIGVIAKLVNVTKKLEKEGVSVKVMRSGDKKARINPLETPRDVDLADLQTEMDYVHGKFINAVAEGRGQSPELVRARIGDGSTMFAEEAVQIGLIDEVSSFDDALIYLASSLGSEEAPSSGRGVGGMFVADETPALNASKTMEGDMPKGIFKKTPAKEIITPEAQAAIIEGAEVSDVIGGGEEVQAEVVAPVVEANGEGSEVSEAEPTVPGEGVEDQEPVTGSTQLIDKLLSMTTDLGLANSKVSELEDKLSAQEATQEKLLGVVKEAINRMNVALSASPQEFSACSAENLLTMYEQNQTRLRERYPVGQQVESEDLSVELIGASDNFNDTVVGLVSRKK